MPLSFLHLFGLWFRGHSRWIPVLWRAAKFVQRHELGIHINALDAHLLAGGSLEPVLIATLAAKKAGHGDRWRELSAANIMGEDLEAFVARGYVSVHAIAQKELEERAKTDPTARRELHSQCIDRMRRLERSIADVQALAIPGMDSVIQGFRDAQARIRQEITDLERQGF